MKRLFAAAKKDNELELLIYSQIGGGLWSEGVTAKDIKQAIDDAGPDITRIVARINSRGGDVFEGVTIYNLFAQSKVPVDIIVDGLAASAASIISMAGRKISMGANTMMMVHNAAGMAFGDAKKMREFADLLDTVSNTMCETYAKRTGLSAEDVKVLLDAETWMTAEVCKEKGFTDEVIEAPKRADAKKAATAMAFASADLPKFGYKNIPTALVAEAADDGCTCSCQPCQDGDCAECTMDPCESDGCTCADAKAACKKKATATARERERITLELAAL